MKGESTMAQTTVNYDELMQVYSSPLSTAKYVRPKRKDIISYKSFYLLRKICNLLDDDISDQELRSIVIGGIIVGALSLPLLSITIIFLNCLVYG
jgi:hypothetical protein